MVARLTEPWNAGSACYLRILGEISPCLTGPEVSRSLQTRNEQVRGSSPLVGFPEVTAKVPPYVGWIPLNHVVHYVQQSARADCCRPGGRDSPARVGDESRLRCRCRLSSRRPRSRE